MIRLAPSILSADFSRIGEEVKMVEQAGADLVHIDIMDGHFVPNLTLGPQVVSAVKRVTFLSLDVHLMVENPGFFIPLFHEAGADWLSIHVEAARHLHREIELIKGLGMKAGLALNPGTPIRSLDEILPDLDFILLMSVNPGFGGQKFIQATHQKIRNLRDRIKSQKLNIPIEVDGGINAHNMQALIQDGVEILVAGAAIFASANRTRAIRDMKEIIDKHNPA